MQNFSLTWDLDSLFSGGSHSSALHSLLHHVKHQLQKFERKFHQLSDIKQGILYFQELDGHCRDLQYFIDCLLSQNVEDQKALQLHSEVNLLRARCDSLGEELNVLLAGLDQETIANLLANPDLEPIAFHLQERIQQTKEKLPIEQEQLIHQLGIDGYQGWSNIYDMFIGQLQISSPFSPEELLSVGQAANRLFNIERPVRQAWFQRWEETWSLHENLSAQMLNHLAGFRLNVYKARGWHSILHEPLWCNRMQEQTLTAMWNAVNKHKASLVKYLKCKARILGVQRLAWHDVEAPLPFSEEPETPFQEAAEFIIRDFHEFSPAMGVFAQEAFEKRWIEAEDRSGKRPGGFCASFLSAQESRIFMTYSGTMMNILTLAHELGHAYHSYEVREQPIFAQQYPMNVAETASTLAEIVVINGWMRHSEDPKVQLTLLDMKLQRAVMFLMNIHARFLFELDFYHERQKGFVLPHRLNALMEQAQRQAFGEELSEWHPHFWVAKQHFFITEVPFYNFPYTFGYLFSQGVYAHLKDHSTRDQEYAALLRDTGRLPVEELANRHLGIQLQEPDFWEKALKLIEEDISAYLQLYRTLVSTH